jgi:hypothetical protein
MEDRTKRTTSHGGRALTAFLLISPLLLMTAYLWVSREFLPGWTRTADFAALIASVAVGLVGIWRLPCSTILRALFALVYAAGVLLLLFAWSLGFVCAAFGDCL